MARKILMLAAAALAGAATAPRASAAEASPVAVAARLAQDANAARLVFDLSQPVEARAYALSNPDRIVVDLPAINFQVDPAVGRPRKDAPLVRAFRCGALEAGKARIVIDLARPACPDRVASQPIAEGEPASRLAIELKACDENVFSALAQPPQSAVVEPAQAGPPVIVLDPGHGGVDGGAHGLGGVLEKTLVYEFALELKHQLESTHEFRILMTRDGDEYVGLGDRVAIARDANAALLISLHADTLNEAPGVGGSTVYTVADRASDAEAARIAARENAADRDSAKEKRTQEDSNVSDILFDLKRRETRLYAHVFSRGLVGSLSSTARLNRNPERAAGFVVLKAPEFPSVLVELGYLSNAEDVRALSSPDWRKKTAAATVRAVEAFFAEQGRGIAANPTGVALEARQAGRTGR
ncbi:MAG TPA: N-acetylmuramoyl-L-alanine amidase [Roseiarcus sp.]|nr:N-acetylmuramoyl-L-alanine amidase [Roseiarcus sp.]